MEVLRWTALSRLLLLLLLAVLLADARFSNHSSSRDHIPILRVSSSPRDALDSDGVLTVDEGDQVQLTCTTGYKQHKVSWYEGHTELQSSSNLDSIRLTLPLVSREDDGRKLDCRVYDSTIYRRVTLSVQKRSNLVQLHISSNQNHRPLLQQQVLRVTAGSSLTLYCFTPGRKSHRLSWWEEKESRTASHIRGGFISLDLGTVTRQLEGRQFTCRADGSTMHRTLILEVHDREFKEEKIETVMRSVSSNALLLLLVGATLLCSIVVVVAVFMVIKLRIVHEKMVKNTRKKRSTRRNSAKGGHGSAKNTSISRSLENQMLLSAGTLTTPAHAAAVAASGKREQARTQPKEFIKEGSVNAAFSSDV